MDGVAEGGIHSLLTYIVQVLAIRHSQKIHNTFFYTKFLLLTVKEIRFK